MNAMQPLRKTKVNSIVLSPVCKKQETFKWFLTH